MPPGVVIGLAYNSRGGAILYIESKRANDNGANSVGTLKVTGQLGSVMQESSAIALTYARDFLMNHDSDKFTDDQKMKAMEFLQK